MSNTPCPVNRTSVNTDIRKLNSIRIDPQSSDYKISMEQAIAESKGILFYGQTAYGVITPNEHGIPVACFVQFSLSLREARGFCEDAAAGVQCVHIVAAYPHALRAAKNAQPANCGAQKDGKR